MKDLDYENFKKIYEVGNRSFNRIEMLKNKPGYFKCYNDSIKSFEKSDTIMIQFSKLNPNKYFEYKNKLLLEKKYN